MFLITTRFSIAAKINMSNEFKKITENFIYLDLLCLDTGKDQGIHIGYL